MLGSWLLLAVTIFKNLFCCHTLNHFCFSDASTSNTVSNFLLEKSSVVLQLEQQRFSPTGSHDSHSWTMGSDFSDELGDLNIEGEDLTLQHVPIEEWGCSLTD